MASKKTANKKPKKPKKAKLADKYLDIAREVKENQSKKTERVELSARQRDATKARELDKAIKAFEAKFKEAIRSNRESIPIFGWTEDTENVEFEQELAEHIRNYFEIEGLPAQVVMRAGHKYTHGTVEVSLQSVYDGLEA